MKSLYEACADLCDFEIYGEVNNESDLHEYIKKQILYYMLSMQDHIEKRKMDQYYFDFGARHVLGKIATKLGVEIPTLS